MKFKKINTTAALRLQDLGNEPFEGVYLGKQKNRFNTDDYRFFSRDRTFVIYGTQVLHQAMAYVEPGFAVKINYMGEQKLTDDRSYLHAEVEVSEEPVPGFDVSAHQSEELDDLI